MPLARYGVVIGTRKRFRRDNANHYGNYFHGKVYVATPAGEYECAVDFASPLGVEVRYRVVLDLDEAQLSGVTSLPDGYHDLAKTPVSGALDYVRSPLFDPWSDCLGNDGLDVLERLLRDSKRLFVFGEPYRRRSRLGMHDIHCNQGDPPGPHRHNNGIWQDGGIVIRRNEGELVAFLIKFATQSLATDENGLPI